MSALRQHCSSQDRVSDLLPGNVALVAPAGFGARFPAGAASNSIRVSPAMMILLKAIAAYERFASVDALIADMAAERARAAGIPRLLRAVCDLEAGAANQFQQGGEAVSHLVHTQEVGSSNLPPATSCVLPTEREASPRWPADNAPEKPGGLRSQPCVAQTHNPESEKGPEGVPRGALRSPP